MIDTKENNKQKSLSEKIEESKQKTLKELEKLKLKLKKDLGEIKHSHRNP